VPRVEPGVQRLSGCPGRQEPRRRSISRWRAENGPHKRRSNKIFCPKKNLLLLWICLKSNINKLREMFKQLNNKSDELHS